MTDAEFDQLTDAVLLKIEQAFDDIEADFEVERSGGVLTIECPDRSQLVLNKQEPLHQIWLATKFDGHHFELTDKGWIDNRSGRELFELVTDALLRQSGEQFQF